MQNAQELRQLLQWYLESGVDETIDTHAKDHFQLPEVTVSAALSASGVYDMPPGLTEPPYNPGTTMSRSAPLTNGAILPPSKAMMQAQQIAQRVTSIAELKQAVLDFDGCLLKKSATTTVFADGHEDASVMVIGEAPGEQEDLSGIPFCGKSGQLLDNILASIGLTRAENLYITNTIFWRPPGNRTPSMEEVAICAPLVKKHIALKAPKLIVLAGSVASSVLNTNLSVSKLRGKFHHYHNEFLDKEIPAVVIYHPSYLLRQPGQKAQAWRDMLMVQAFLESQEIDGAAH